jgi:hypothetical protein
MTRGGVVAPTAAPPHPTWEEAMPELVTYFGQVALVLAAMLVVLALCICVLALVTHAARAIRRLYGL